MVTLLGELLEGAGTKVVVFSQWLRMHELLARRLEGRRWGYVLFHGGVDGDRRKALVDRFREDDGCRVFLSTDAGGVGLNLQHAHVVVNVDLPWNPAVLEQRIGRVHRLGQRRPVQVVNVIAQGTIEESMLSLLGFKELLFAGVLDGGEAQVFLGGSRLGRFIERVEQVTGAIPTAPLDEASAAPAGPAARAAGGTGSDEEAPAGAAAERGADPLLRLVRSGQALLEQLAAALGEPAPRTPDRAGNPSIPARIGAVAESHRTAGGNGRGRLEMAVDGQTGERYLRLRMPPADVLARAVEGIHGFLEGLRL